MSYETLSHSKSDDLEAAEKLEEAVGALDCQRLKILVSAFACSPSKGSEEGVGWGWVEAIAKYHDLWVLTGDQCRDDIEAELQNKPKLLDRLHFHYVPWTRHTIAEKVWPPTHLYTYRHLWQKAAYELGMRLHKEIHFDIVHQLTYVGFRVPGLLWQLDVPFVWGPIGGLEQTTWALLPSLGVRGCLHYSTRNILNDWDRRVSRAPKRAFAKAGGGIIAATSGVQQEILRFYGQESTVISEIGLPPLARARPALRNSTEPLSLLWCGLHLPGKALQFLLSALRQLPSSLNWKLTIIGDGPCSARWRRLARATRLDDRCDWLGLLPRQEVLKRMQAAHVMVITSIKDLTSTVVVEALANGLPVICPNHCGFKDAVTPECGIKVSATSSVELVQGLRDAIVRLYDEGLRLRLANGALHRALDYKWDLKAKTVNDIYFKKASTHRAGL